MDVGDTRAETDSVAKQVERKKWARERVVGEESVCMSNAVNAEANESVWFFPPLLVDSLDLAFGVVVCSMAPYNGSEIQVIGGFVEWGFDEEGPGKADAHAPSSRHILGGFVYRRLRNPRP